MISAFEYCKVNLPIQSHGDIFLCVLLEALLFSFSHLGLSYCVCCEVEVEVYFFPYEYPDNPAPFIEISILFPTAL